MTGASSAPGDRNGNHPEFLWQVRVYYEDTDAGGVVYHSNYLNYMERARTEWLRAAGYSQQVLTEQAGVSFVVSSLKVDYRIPARFDELLEIRSEITGISGTRLFFHQTITNNEGVLKCRGDIDIVCIDARTFKPRRIPDEIKVKLINDN